MKESCSRILVSKMSVRISMKGVKNIQTADCPVHIGFCLDCIIHYTFMQCDEIKLFLKPGEILLFTLYEADEAGQSPQPPHWSHTV